MLERGHDLSKCLMADLLNILFEFGLAEPLGIRGRHRLEAIFKVMDPRSEKRHVAHRHTAEVSGGDPALGLLTPHLVLRTGHWIWQERKSMEATWGWKMSKESELKGLKA